MIFDEGVTGRGIIGVEADLPKKAEWIVPHIIVTPGIPLLLETFIKRGASAFMLSTNALGSVGDGQLEEIREATKKGITIIILPDNSDEKHGVIKLGDKQQLLTREAGGVFLEAANDATQALTGNVGKAIIEELNNGKKGGELAKAVQEKFKLKRMPQSSLGTTAGLRGHMKSMGLK